MATLAFQRAIPGGDLGQGAAISTAMIPFLIAATLFSYYGLQGRKWQQGGADDWGGQDGPRRLRGDEVPGHAAAARGDGLYPAGPVRHRSAVPVLLDGRDHLQTERTASEVGRPKPLPERD